MAADVWYHLYPLGFLGAPPVNDGTGPVEHRLPALEGWLDYLHDLGITGLLLGPLFESESHGYDTVDPFRVDRRLGDEGDLVTLVEQCRRRGIRVILDGVFHHVGRRHHAFQDVLTRGRASPYADWFHIDFDRPGPDGFAYRSFEGHAQLVSLNHGNPAVLDWAVDVARRWMDRGISGWRLDAAYAVPVRFWSDFCGRIGGGHDPFLVAEVIHGDYARLVTEGGVSTVTQYELWKAIWSALNDGNLFELSHALSRHGQLCAAFAPWNFVGNHDTTRIATQLSDPRHLGHALALLFTLPGVPAVYAGDEQGAQGTKRHEAGGDDDVRRPPPQRPGELTGTPLDIYRLHRHLAAVRRDHPWLARADVQVEELSNESATLRLRGGDGQLTLSLNVGDAPARLHLAGEVLAGNRDDPLPSHDWVLRRPG